MSSFFLIFFSLLNLLLFLGGLVVLVALVLMVIGLWLRRHDPALRLLDAFPAVIEHEDGARQAGVLRVRDGGITLEFAIPSTKHSPSLPTIYLHYQVEFTAINAIYRFVDELDKEDRAQRQRQLKKINHWLLRRRPLFWRTLSLRLADAWLAFVARLRGHPFPRFRFHPHPVTGGSLLIGLWGDAYNSLLEPLVGKPVVVRHLVGNTLHHHQGTLLSYSPQFLLLAGVPVSEFLTLTLSHEKGVGQELTLRWQWREEQLQIHNSGTFPLFLDAIHLGEQTRSLSMLVAPGQDFVLRVTPPAHGTVKLEARVTREADMLLPRERAIIRHAVELPGPLAAVDMGLVLKPSREREQEEEYLRRELQQRPDNAAAAVALARLLTEKGEWHEAERFYRQALTQTHHLPDQGRRAQLELDQLRIRRAGEGRK